VSHGVGIPDDGLFTPDQFQKEPEPLPGTVPARGVIEAKPTSDDAFITADSKQVSKYWGRNRQVLVTNYRDFLLSASIPKGTRETGPAIERALESYGRGSFSWAPRLIAARPRVRLFWPGRICETYSG
jgi:hypothetical protein